MSEKVSRTLLNSATEITAYLPLILTNYRGGYRNFLRGGGTVNKSYQKVGVDPRRGWVREGDMPPPARSAEAFDTIYVLRIKALKLC